MSKLYNLATFLIQHLKALYFSFHCFYDNRLWRLLLKLTLAHTAVWKVLLLQIILMYPAVSRLWARCYGIWILEGTRDFYFSKISRLTVGFTQLPVHWVSGVIFVGIKQVGREADHSSPSTAEVKNEWSYASAPQCLHGIHRCHFPCTFIFHFCFAPLCHCLSKIRKLRKFICSLIL